MLQPDNGLDSACICLVCTNMLQLQIACDIIVIKYPRKLASIQFAIISKCIYHRMMKNIHNEILIFTRELHERDKKLKQKDFDCSINHNN